MVHYRGAGVPFSPSFRGRSEAAGREVRKVSFRGSARQPEDWTAPQNLVDSLVKNAREQRVKGYRKSRGGFLRSAI